MLLHDGYVAMFLSLVSIHVLAGSTAVLDASRYIGTNAHKQSQPSQQSLLDRIKVAHVELFRRYAKLVPRYAVTVTHGN